MPDPAEKTAPFEASSTVVTRSARRAQTAIDSGAALVLTMLVWPFPLARAALTPIVNVACVLVLWQILQVSYFVVTMAVWGATAGTRVMGLRVVDVDGEVPSRGQRARWGALSGVIAIGRVVVPPRAGERDMPERSARVDIISASFDD